MKECVLCKTLYQKGSEVTFHKIKSDRINALRKQYDAFLEEDKKRKERNEYILGRLDQMRYSTALLPLRRKSGIILEQHAAHYQRAVQQEKLSARDFQLSCANPIQIVKDLPLTNVGSVPETVLIQEISKKYILIPKLRPPFMNNTSIDVNPSFDTKPVVDIKVKKEVKISDVDNSDWKSKYEILNILKNEEKEEAPIQTNKDSSLNETEREVLYNNVENINESVVTVDKDHDAGHKYIDEIPEKDLLDQLGYELPSAETEYAPNHQYDDHNSVDASDTIKEQTGSTQIISYGQNEPIIDIDRKLQHTNIECKNAGEFNNQPANLTEYEQNVEMQPPYDVNTASNYYNQQNLQKQSEYEISTGFNDPNQQAVFTENAIENVDTTYQAEAEASNHFEHDTSEQVQDITSTENAILGENISQTQVLTHNEFVEDINKATPIVEPETYVDNVEYPVDIINVQEFTPNDDVHLKDGVNINPDVHMMQKNNFELTAQDIPQLADNTENSQKPVDTAGIEEFEAEQQGLFYSEHPGENNPYQGGDGDDYNPEYEQNKAYVHNESDYYDSTQPEVYQPVEINEHEETTQQYDQNYEQQYVGSYEQEYEQQPYEQNDQQYQESGEIYPSQHELEELQYQQQNEETPEQVQQDIDNEQGYAEMQNIVQANQQEIVKANESEMAAVQQQVAGVVQLS